jgi:large subunit ribosomal protein LP0
MPGGDPSQRKQSYYGRLLKLLVEYKKILLVSADNVGSYHLQKIRQSLRGEAVLLMGKNTMIRKAMREHQIKHPEIEPFIAHVYGNIGLVFVKDTADLAKVRKVITDYKIEAYAKAGSLAPCDVVVPKGDTGMDPGKTSFFQALSIQTKINKGKIEIINDLSLLKKGDKVSASQAVLLQMLDIKPFIYGLHTLQAYDNGSVISPSVLDYTDDDVLTKFRKGVSRVASLGLSIGYPTVASLPHEVSAGYQNLLAISLATSYSFKGSEELKRLLSDPAALKAAQAAAAPAATTTTTTAAPAGKKEEKKEEKKDEKKKKKGDDDDDAAGGMGGLFGGDDEEEKEGEGEGGGAMGGLFGDAEED